VPSHELIERHVAGLAARLPAGAVTELADGLIETYAAKLADGRDPATAATAAIAEFGTVDEITRAFVAQAPGRRTAAALLCTGPVVGACWAASLLAGRAWTWPLPPATRYLLPVTLLTVVCTLAAAVTSRRSYRRTRIAAIGGLGVIGLDTTMIGIVLLAAPALVWPMALAVPASAVRLMLTVRAMRGVLDR
jgi:hypothetical protein